MAKHRSYSVAFKHHVVQEFLAGESLHSLGRRHDVSRNLIRIWVGKYEAGAFDEDVQAADLIQEGLPLSPDLPRRHRRGLIEARPERRGAQRPVLPSAARAPPAP